VREDRAQARAVRLCGCGARPIRAVVPPIRVGGASLDLSPIILIIGIQLIPVVLGWFF
jgi:uncharacterized protein YggT (Ycf19 family)